MLNLEWKSEMFSAKFKFILSAYFVMFCLLCFHENGAILHTREHIFTKLICIHYVYINYPFMINEIKRQYNYTFSAYLVKIKIHLIHLDLD